MVLNIFLRYLRKLVHRHHRPDLFDQSNIIFVPFVNIDGYIFINEHWEKFDWNKAKFKRKNFNHKKICKKNSIDSGVDINRNYDFKFAYDNEGSGSDPCDDTYRGEYPFSEPETLAIKNLVERTPKIEACMNFHAFGNLWIFPYNYYKGDDKDVMKPEVYEFYKNYSDQIDELGFKHYGNAEETI